MIAHGSCIVNTRFRIQDERMDDLGSLIRRTREERGLVQAALARMAEIPQGTLSRIETGSYKDVPPPEIIGALSRVLEIPQYQMLRLIGYDVGPATSVDTDTDPVLQELIDRTACRHGQDTRRGHRCRRPRLASRLCDSGGSVAPAAVHGPPRVRR